MPAPLRVHPPDARLGAPEPRDFGDDVDRLEPLAEIASPQVK